MESLALKNNVEHRYPARRMRVNWWCVRNEHGYHTNVRTRPIFWLCQSYHVPCLINQVFTLVSKTVKVDKVVMTNLQRFQKSKPIIESFVKEDQVMSQIECSAGVDDAVKFNSSGDIWLRLSWAKGESKQELVVHITSVMSWIQSLSLLGFLLSVLVKFNWVWHQRPSSVLPCEDWINGAQKHQHISIVCSVLCLICLPLAIIPPCLVGDQWMEQQRNRLLLGKGPQQTPTHSKREKRPLEEDKDLHVFTSCRGRT